MLCLGIDPGDSPGYAVWQDDAGEGSGGINPMGMLVWADVKPPPYACDIAVVESGWPHGKAGKVQMWGLGFGAGWRLCTADAAVKYTIAPKAWRAALGGQPANAPKDVIVARLRVLRYRGYVNAAQWTDDVIEAAGIAESAALILARPLKKDRKELKEVKR